MNPRPALDRLINALETFHLATSTVQGPNAPNVVETADTLADACIVYDDVAFTRYGAEAPLDVYSDDGDYGEDFDDNHDDLNLDDEDSANLDDDLGEESDFDDDSEGEDDLEDDKEIDGKTFEDEEGPNSADFDDDGYEEGSEEDAGS